MAPHGALPHFAKCASEHAATPYRTRAPGGHLCRLQALPSCTPREKMLEAQTNARGMEEGQGEG